MPRSCAGTGGPVARATRPAPPTRGPPRRATGPAPSELEEVDEVLRRHGREAAVGVCGRAGVSGVLREEGTGVTHAGHQLLV